MIKRISLIALLLAPLIFYFFRPRESQPFSPEAISAHAAFNPEWEARSPNAAEAEEIACALEQPYKYLGGGGQCYAFVSQDERYVIKFLKQKAFALPPWIERFPLPFIKEKAAKKKEQKKNKVLRAFKISFDHLSEETGVLLAHLNPTSSLKRVVSFTDAKGSTHALALDAPTFVLQKKAELGASRIDALMKNNDVAGAKRAIEQLLALNLAIYQKGYRNRDPNFRSNCGFIGEQAILIDFGRIVCKKNTTNLRAQEKELLKMAPRLQKYLAAEHPALLEHFEGLIAKMVPHE